MPEYSNTAMLAAIAEYVHNARYREVLRLRFCEGLTHEEIAGVVGYSTQHVKHICKAYKSLLINRI